MKTLIIYSSKYGQTRKIATRIARQLKAQQQDVEAFEIGSLTPQFSIAHFDAVILGSPIYATKHSSKLGKLIKRNRDALATKRTAFFSVSLSAAGNAEQRGDAVRCMDQFLESMNWNPNVTTIFAGGLPYREYNWFTRWLLKRMVRSEGGDTDTSKNHEYTDWSLVDDFAGRFFDDVGDESSGILENSTSI